MKNQMILALILFFQFSWIFPQTGQEEVLMTIHNHEITLGEFERYYHKNNSVSNIEKQSVNEYLEHFINFKLKVTEAEELGYDTTEAFIREFSEYREQLAQPYLTRKKDMEDLLKEAYERAQTDLHLSHITIPCDPDAPPADTVFAFERATAARQRILNGENFDSVALNLVEDSLTNAYGGELGYITVFNLIYPLETAAYQTAPGEISQPVRTQYGYHIIKVNKRRPSPGYIKVAHILAYTPDTLTEEQLQEAEWEINAIYDSLLAGYSFEDLARRNSDDRQSAEMGGELPYFKTGQTFPEFHETALTLKKPGEFSRPFKTPVGWHIVKLIDHQDIGNFEAVKTEHTDQINKSNRLRSSRLAMLEQMKKKYGFRDLSKDMEVFFRIIDSSIFKGNWSIPEDTELNGVLFTIGSQEYTGYDFARFLEENKPEFQMSKRTLLTRGMTDFIEESLMHYEKQQLPVNHPEYKYLLGEYHDGLLLFYLTDQVVLSKAIKDTTGLRSFYTKNMRNYLWEKRLDCILISCEQREVAEKAVNIVRDQETEDVTRSSLIAGLCAPHFRAECIIFTEGTYEPGDNDLTDKMNWNNRISEIYELDDRFVFILRKNIIPAGQKSLDEARGQVITDYQDYLDKIWITELRKKYRVKVNRKRLSKID